MQTCADGVCRLKVLFAHAVAHSLSSRVKLLNEPIDQAANDIIFNILNTDAGNGGLIAVDAQGNFTMPFNSTGMFRGYLYKQDGTIQKAVGILDEMR